MRYVRRVHLQRDRIADREGAFRRFVFRVSQPFLCGRNVPLSEQLLGVVLRHRYAGAQCVSGVELVLRYLRRDAEPRLRSAFPPLVVGVEPAERERQVLRAVEHWHPRILQSFQSRRRPELVAGVQERDQFIVMPVPRVYHVSRLIVGCGACDDERADFRLRDHVLHDRQYRLATGVARDVGGIGRPSEARQNFVDAIARRV